MRSGNSNSAIAYAKTTEPSLDQSVGPHRCDPAALLAVFGGAVSRAPGRPALRQHWSRADGVVGGGGLRVFRLHSGEMMPARRLAFNCTSEYPSGSGGLHLPSRAEVSTKGGVIKPSTDYSHLPVYTHGFPRWEDHLPPGPPETELVVKGVRHVKTIEQLHVMVIDRTIIERPFR